LGDMTAVTTKLLRLMSLGRTLSQSVSVGCLVLVSLSMCLDSELNLG